jgi:cob(I)alamin adenosyltransferase
MRITKVTTRTGDDGTTGLGGGQRVGKDAARIEACGAVDELNSFIGQARALGLDPLAGEELGRVQHDLFLLGGELCLLEEDRKRLGTAGIEERHLERLEALVERLQGELGPLKEFILPGGAPGAAALHVARTVCRRAERRVVALARLESVRPPVVKYLNRLSDLLFVLARHEGRVRGIPEAYWERGR